MKKHGFTLVELLVAIAIITVLAGLVLPALSRARESGRRTVCLNNLRQLFLALEMYVQDYGGCYPIAASLPSLHLNEDPRICDLLVPYLKLPEVFRCPSDNKGYFQREGSSYEYNVSLGGRMAGSGRRASNTWVFYDYEDFHGPGVRNFVYLDGHATHEPIAQLEEEE